MKANRKKMEIAMAQACMNTSDLVKASKMPKPTVTNVITGKSVRPASIGRICRVLGVNAEDIIEFDKED